MEKLLEMSQLEKDFKRLYEEVGYDYANPPIHMKDFEELVSGYGDKYSHLVLKEMVSYLTELEYFEDDEDIAVFHHNRYMPAIWHSHDFIELACVLSGSCTHFIKEQVVSLHAGDICIIAPNTTHGVLVTSDDTVMKNILIRTSTFEQHFLGLLPDHDILYDFFVKQLYHSAETPYITFQTGDDRYIIDQIIAMENEHAKKKRYKNVMLTAQLAKLFVELMRYHESDIIVPAFNKLTMNEDIIFILQYMQKNYATINLSHLAAFFNYSERQMQRIILNATGDSFRNIILKIRMQHAENLLKTTDMSVANIAEQLGYYDTNSFRQAFQKFYGVSPSKYKKAQ